MIALNTDPFLLLFGCLYLVIGLSILLAQQAWKDFTNLYVTSGPLCLITGIIMLPLALYVVVFYNKWTGIAEDFLMVLGYWALFEAMVLLLKPAWVHKIVASGKFVLDPFWLHGLIAIAMGLALLLL